MTRFHGKQTMPSLCAVVLMALLAIPGAAQYGPGGGGTGGGGMGTAPTSIYNFHSNYHLGFDKPEAWGLKYFASASLLSGLQPPPPSEGYHAGSISLGFEADWLPQLSAGQRMIGFNGTTDEDLNKAPIFARVIVRIGLPDKFTAVVAAPPPFRAFGLTSHLLEFGLERPLIERNPWMLSWRGYGQVGSVKGAFTCPAGVASFAPGSPQNPTECVGESGDIASLRYAGSEFQLAYRVPTMPKVIPHVAVGGNFIDGAFQVRAPVVDGFDETRLWTRGGTVSVSGGLSYQVTPQMALLVDAFYTPLWVQRHAGMPTTNDGLFNVRAMVNYTFR